MSQDNPYRAQSMPPPIPGGGGVSQPMLRLAGRGSRFAGAIIDQIVVFASIVPGLLLLLFGSFMAESQGQASEKAIATIVSLSFGLIAIGLLVVLCVQAYLHWTSSQSVGKYFMKTQIFNSKTGSRSSFLECFVVRSLVNAILGQIPFYSLIDALLIFRDDYRCIHDHLAGTIVVEMR